MIYFIATPIGNLDDITIRALKILKSSKYIVCEDTRRISTILNKYHITNKQKIIFNDFNKDEILNKIIEIAEKEDISFVSDAGMPIISDPGYEIVQKSLEKKIKFTIIPGSSASLTALCLSGLKPDKFLFLGFLPKKKKNKKELLQTYLNTIATFIIFENQNRVNETLQIIFDVFGNVDTSIVRELTKIYEEVIRGKIETLIKSLANKLLKGEIVIIFENRKKNSYDNVGSNKITKYINELKKKNFTNKQIKYILKLFLNLENRNIYKILNQI